MDATTAIVFRLLERQVLALEKQLMQIALQPKEAMFHSAMCLRDACFDFVDEYRNVCSELLVNFVREQDQRYQDELVLTLGERQAGSLTQYLGLTDKQKRHDVQARFRLSHSLELQRVFYEARLTAAKAQINQHLGSIYSVLRDEYKINMSRLKP